MYSKESPGEVPAPLKLQFAIPSPVAEECDIASGHQALSEGEGALGGIYALDTGCYWGDTLTCLCWEGKQCFVQPSSRYRDMDEGETVVS